MKEKLSELGHKSKKLIPDFVAFVGLAVIVGATVQIADLDRVYLYPIGYLLGTLAHSRVANLVRSKINLN